MIYSILQPRFSEVSTGLNAQRPGHDLQHVLALAAARQHLQLRPDEGLARRVVGAVLGKGRHDARPHLSVDAVQLLHHRRQEGVAAAVNCVEGGRGAKRAKQAVTGSGVLDTDPCMRNLYFFQWG